MWFGLLFCTFLASATLPDLMAGESTPQIRLIEETELSKRLQFYKTMTQLEVHFNQTKILKELQIQIKSEGNLSLIRPDQVIWEIVKPSRVLVKMHQSEIYIESGKGKELSAQTWKMSDMPKDKDTKSLGGLIAWLQLDAHALSQQYIISAMKAGAFKFEPRDRAGTVFRDLEMTLSSGGHLQSLVIHESSGDEIRLQFGIPKIKRL